MSNPLLVCKNFEINGLEYKLRPLTVLAARPIIPILQRCLGAMELTQGSLKNFLFTAGLGGMLTEQDLDLMVKAFGPSTTVTVPSADGKGDRTLVLDKPGVQDELFGGQLEFMYEWLEACIDFNFAGALAKMYAVVAATVERAKAAKLEESQSPRS